MISFISFTELRWRPKKPIGKLS